MHLSSLLITLLLLIFLDASAAASSNNPATTIKTRVSIDCGSTATFAALNGVEWIGDVRPKPKVSSLLQIKGSSTASTVTRSSTSADQVPHNTARISRSEFSYTFRVNPGEKILRLHFNPAPYKGFKRFKDLFNVEAGPFTLLGNFSASLTAAALGVNTFAKEFWKTPVDVGFRYLVRVHFRDLRLHREETRGVSFTILINEMIVDADIFKQRGSSGILQYRDYVVAVKGRKQEGKRDLSISLQSYDEFIDGHQLIKGFEIFKLSNPDNSLASPNSFPPQRDSPSWIIQYLLKILHSRNATATLVITILTLINIIVHNLRETHEARIMEVENRPSVRAERHCRRFALAEIQSATKNFSEALLIGRGGFGKVYKGLIDNGGEIVAIKRLKPNSKQGKHEFLTEIETLSELRHLNLVSLIGYCSDHKEMILVYEYMTSGTLADHLHKYTRKGDESCSLTWKQRLHICIGAARGLDYLHTGHGIIHRDVKTSNILLDENLTAKVSDFGLAKSEDRSKLQSHVSTKVKGTYGYLDPYYFSTRKLTRKSDTYAFGVVMLEVLCERQAMDPRFGEDEYCLTRWAKNKIKEGEVNQIVASSLMEDILPGSLQVFVEVAERCLYDEPKKRPTMAQVVVQLGSALEQQESRKLTVPTDVCSSNEQATEATTDVHTVTSPPKEKTSSDYIPAGEKAGRKPKPSKQLRFWAWDAFWNRFKPSKRKELSLTSGIDSFYHSKF